MAATEATILSGVAPPWQTDDVGLQHGLGSSLISNQTFIVTGHGHDISGTADEFQYLYRTWSGDAEMVARIANLVNTLNPADGSAKSGVMFRQSLAPDAANSFTFLSLSNGAGFQTRPTVGADTTAIAGPAGGQNWLKLVRARDAFYSYVSSD